jgi:hypothetical protein
MSKNVIESVLRITNIVTICLPLQIAYLDGSNICTAIEHLGLKTLP